MADPRVRGGGPIFQHSPGYRATTARLQVGGASLLDAIHERDAHPGRHFLVPADPEGQTFQRVT
jgi:hypothetical protein